MLDNANQTVLVTGAAGTVGHYALALADAAGYRVIASDLTSNGVQVPTHGEIRVGDLRDQDFVNDVVRGCDYVLHTAALLEPDAQAVDLQRINGGVVGELHRAASEAGVKRFVQISTSLLYARGQERLTEESAVEPQGMHGQSKLDGEKRLHESGEAGAPWTILRSAPLYGRRGRHLAATLLAVGPIMRLVSPIVARPSGGPMANFVHAEDVARAALFVMTRAEAAFQTYNVADEDVMALGERVGATLRAYGLPSIGAGMLPRAVVDRLSRTFASPLAFQAVDGAALTAWKLVVLRYGLKPVLRVRLDKEATGLLSHDWVIDTTKLRALGWIPRHPRFAEGWQSVLRWYQAERWVPRYA